MSKVSTKACMSRFSGHIVLSTVVFFYLELFIRGDLLGTLTWIWSRPAIAVLNISAIYATVGIIICVARSWRSSTALVMALAYTFGMINAMKYSALGQYYYPWDNASLNELGGISDNLGSMEYSKPLMFVFFGILLVVWFWRWDSKNRLLSKLSMQQGIMTILIGSLLIGSLVYNREFKLNNWLGNIGVQNYAWAPAESYKKNGSIIGYLINVRANYVEKPKDYSRRKIEDLMEEINLTPSALKLHEGSKEGIKPNIIVIMGESLWDPSQLSKVQFVKNPMENLNEARISSFVTPTFGGYTCNVEFEFLTGMSMKFLPPASVPYQYFIKRSIPSLPGEFKNNGYVTKAVHPYKPWFWNRDQVYPRLSFDEFIAEENFNVSSKKGYYISDDSVIQRVISEIESTDEPLFLFAVTMQNHGPFKDNRYKATGSPIAGPEAAKDDQMIATYYQGVKDSDLAFKRLSEYVESSDEETLVIEFGDHLPVLGDQFDAYQKYGYIREGIRSFQEMSPNEQLKIRSTQVSAVSNYKDISLPPYVSPSLLSAHVLQYAGARMGPFYQMLSTITNDVSCIFGQNVIDNIGNMRQMDGKTAEKYRLMQYDLLLGKQYYYDVLNTQ